jgi:hypothetical protein
LGSCTGIDVGKAAAALELAQELHVDFTNDVVVGDTAHDPQMNVYLKPTTSPLRLEFPNGEVFIWNAENN